MDEVGPGRIWLQWDLDDDPVNEQTWCVDKINDSDTEYVRADEIERLREELADIKDGNRIILDEKCASDEKHCGCVPTLRKEIERLRSVERNYRGELPDPILKEIERLRAQMSQPRALIVEALQAACDENVKQRAVLEFYAEKENYTNSDPDRVGSRMDRDYGTLARAALGDGSKRLPGGPNAEPSDSETV